MEVVVYQSTIISASSKKITSLPQELAMCENITLYTFHCTDDYMRVKVEAKVIRVDTSI